MSIYHTEHIGDLLPELSAEDAAKPQAKYYYEGPAPLSLENQRATSPGNPIDPKDAIYPDQLNKLVDHSPIEPETGYCVLPDGVGYAAVCTKMTGITMPMIGWFGKWKMEDPLNYALWCPGAHIRHTEEWCCEDLGFGLVDLTLRNAYTMEDFGFDPKNTTPESGFVMAAGGNWHMKCRTAAPDEPPYEVLIFHTVRRIKEGLEWRTRFYIGYRLEKGKYTRELLPGQVVTEEMARCFAEHSAYEMATRQRDLPALYAEFAGK